METIIVRLTSKNGQVLGREVVVTAKPGTPEEEMVAYGVHCIIEEFFNVEVSSSGLFQKEVQARVYDN